MSVKCDQVSTINHLHIWLQTVPTENGCTVKLKLNFHLIPQKVSFLKIFNLNFAYVKLSALSIVSWSRGLTKMSPFQLKSQFMVSFDWHIEWRKSCRKLHSAQQYLRKQLIADTSSNKQLGPLLQTLENCKKLTLFS